VREDWRLWTALAVFAFSAFGRFLVVPLLARPDRTPYAPTYGAGRMLASPTGSSLYVEEAGLSRGPTLIFTHGWGLDSTIWTLAKRDLAARYRLILWDLPGLGRSKAAKDGITLESFATDLQTIIGLTDGQRPLLVGHSIGGMTIQTLARDNPDFVNARVAGLALFNTTYTDPLQTMALSGLVRALRWPVLEPALRLTKWLEPLAQLGAWQSYLSGGAHMATRFEFASHVTRRQLEHTTLLGVKNRQAVIASGNLAMFRWDATSALAPITAPILVLGGDADIVTKVVASRVIASDAKRSRLEIAPEANHMGFVERADTYNAALAHFASEVLSAAPAVERV
jgi:pimeloyl-ACP methyl ester carboxylesterase